LCPVPPSDEGFARQQKQQTSVKLFGQDRPVDHT
jgi:hypothetical protein